MTPSFLARPLAGVVLVSLAGATLAATQIHVAPYVAPLTVPAPAPPALPGASAAPAAKPADARAVQTVLADAPAPASAPLAASAPVPKAAPALAPFAVHAGDDLVLALAAWCQAAGWHFDWQAQSAAPGRLRHFVADADWATHPGSVQDLLRRTLAGLGVRAQVLDADRRVVVRNDNFSEE